MKVFLLTFNTPALLTKKEKLHETNKILRFEKGGGDGLVGGEQDIIQPEIFPEIPSGSN